MLLAVASLLGPAVLTYTLKNPDTLDIIFYNKDECIKFGRISSTTTMRICAREIFEDFASSVNDLLDPTLVIMSPLARFAFNFTFFVMRVLVQQLVLLTEYDESHHGKLIFDNLEILHATICVGFLMAEVQEVRSCVVSTSKSSGLDIYATNVESVSGSFILTRRSAPCSDSALVLPVARASIEKQCDDIAKGLADKEEVVVKSLKMFEEKFSNFVSNIAKMDVLFGSSFTEVRQL